MSPEAAAIVMAPTDLTVYMNSKLRLDVDQSYALFLTVVLEIYFSD